MVNGRSFSEDIAAGMITILYLVPGFRKCGALPSFHHVFLAYSLNNGLRGLEVTFPPHDPSDAGSNPAEVIEFLRTEKFREQVLREGL
jgi:hypothetical protein